AAGRGGSNLRGTGVPAGGSVRSDRRRRRLRGWLHGLPRASRGGRHRPDAAGNGLWRNDGLVLRVGLRRAGLPGCQLGRRGAARSALRPSHPDSSSGAGRVTDQRQYAAAGVDLQQADDAKARICRLVSGTRTALSVGAVGAFGGMVKIPAGINSPVLVMSTDGVGTKVLVAQQAGRHDTVGEDLVNHSVNDILVHGAVPIAFLDYVAGHRLPVEMVAAIVEGVARGCRNHAMALAGGETAQMPGLYAESTFDLAGTIIGVVEE